MKDDTFEIKSIELVYGNKDKHVTEKVSINEKSAVGAELLDRELIEDGRYSDPEHIQVTLYDWATRLVNIIRLHTENECTIDPDMYEALKEINESNESPFKGMIDMPNEEDLIFKRKDD